MPSRLNLTSWSLTACVYALVLISRSCQFSIRHREEAVRTRCGDLSVLVLESGEPFGWLLQSISVEDLS